MCNHYRQAILRGERIPGWSIDQFSEIRIPIRFHNMAADVFPDREGLVIRVGGVAPPAAAGPLSPRPSTDALRAAQDEGSGGSLVVEAMRWGFPPPPNAGAYYVTNVRNVASGFWKPWLKVEHRCIVPVAQFAEPDPEKPKPRAERWFARSDGAPMFFAGIWRDWAGDRGPKSKPVAGPHRIFAFLTCEPNGVVAPIHPKAMPVVLSPAEAQVWLTAAPAEALALQKPLADEELVLLEREA
jgi:putative SOS response-associated peptidase YedK